jgi:hypothetical protein
MAVHLALWGLGGILFMNKATVLFYRGRTGLIPMRLTATLLCCGMILQSASPHSTLALFIGIFSRKHYQIHYY